MHIIMKIKQISSLAVYIEKRCTIFFEFADISVIQK